MLAVQSSMITPLYDLRIIGVRDRQLVRACIKFTLFLYLPRNIACHDELRARLEHSDHFSNLRYEGCLLLDFVKLGLGTDLVRLGAGNVVLRVRRMGMKRFEDCD